MRKLLSCSALFALLLAASLPLAAQKVKIENQGEAAITAEARQLSDAAVEDAIGKAPPGRSQIVFYRSSSSPGTAVAVRDAAGAEPIISLDPGMYYVTVTTPGSHSYATADTGPFPIDLEPGRTYYVQAIRNKQGATQLLRSSADKFQRAANR
jgi:hypothetical protein